MTRRRPDPNESPPRVSASDLLTELQRRHLQRIVAREAWQGAGYTVAPAARPRQTPLRPPEDNPNPDPTWRWRHHFGGEVFIIDWSVGVVTNAPAIRSEDEVAFIVPTAPIPDETLRALDEIEKRRQAERQAAIERSNGLLCSMLTPEQRDTLQSTGRFKVAGRDVDYFVNAHGPAVANLRDSPFRLRLGLCVIFADSWPYTPADQMIMHKLMIEADETGFWRAAGHPAVRCPGDIVRLLEHGGYR